MSSKAVTAAGNSDGSVAISIEGKNTYHYFGVAQALPANCTDFILIRGSASKTVKLKKCRMAFCWAGATQSIPLLLLRRSTDNTGGTRAPVAASYYDVFDPPPTAVVYTYSVLASPLGTLAAYLDFARAFSADYTSAAFELPKIGFDLCLNLDMPIILRGTSDFLALNFYGTASNTQLDFDITLEEDNS